jgi:hypothetical protein
MSDSRSDPFDRLNLPVIGVRMLIRICTIVALFAASSSALAAACDPAVMPLPDQQADETVSPADAALESGCMDQIRTRISRRGTTLGKPAFSKS